MNYTDPYFILGTIGAALILIAFSMNQFKKWNTEDFMYDLTNLLGSIFLVIYAINGKVWPFIILNSVWALVSLKDLVIKNK